MQLLITIILIILYLIIRGYLDDKKMKQLSYNKIEAKIIKLNTEWQEREYETTSEHGRRETIRYEVGLRSFIYEYAVDGNSYTGIGNTYLKKKNGQYITIYYNTLKPEENKFIAKDKQLRDIVLIILLSMILALFRTMFRGLN